MTEFGVFSSIDNLPSCLASQEKSSWDALKDAMHDRIQELRRFTQLRVDGEAGFTGLPWTGSQKTSYPALQMATDVVGKR